VKPSPAAGKPSGIDGAGSFPVVGIGASAGGIEAFTEMFRHLPPGTGMGFVVVTHLDPTHDSILSELLSRKTNMPVMQVVDGVAVRPNSIYVIPPNALMEMRNGALKLLPRSAHEQHMPVDCFLRSLAAERGERAIGVILSGSASDGALGIAAIKAAGGVTFAQDEESAKYPGMPQSAIATGAVDLIRNPEEIARELRRIGKHPYVRRPREEFGAERDGEDSDYRQILRIVRAGSGIDFTRYKATTIRRRIARRMALHTIHTLRSYAAFLQRRPDEVEALSSELLISVTSFFRDPAAFEALRKRIFPAIVKNRRRGETIRIWVPGCSTGEEVYSLAICLTEYMTANSVRLPVQIFATDVNEAALHKARRAEYIENIAQDVSRDRLRRFFAKTDRGYEVSKTLRNVCVFARQDVTSDPPFSRVDLISCRNVLIYLEGELQKKVIHVLHFALNPGGFLLLGASEAISGFSEYFSAVDVRRKIFVKRSSGRAAPVSLPARAYLPRDSAGIESAFGAADGARGELDVQREADRLVLDRYAPPGVLVNDQFVIVQFRGDTRPYLSPAPGKASFQLFRMANEEMLADLRSTIRQAKKTGSTAHREHVPAAGDRRIMIKVTPVRLVPESPAYFLILFEEKAPSPASPPEAAVPVRKTRSGIPKDRRETEQLRRELVATREYLQSIIEEQEAANEELRSANEEVLSSNEELQSTNEELETAKEELQSTNEELTTVNEEVQNRNVELGQLNNDLSNLLSTVNLPIVMLGNDLRVRRFTPPAEKLLNLIPSDIGRPLRDINTNLRVENLSGLLLEVIETVTPKELEVQDKEGRWHLLRLRPYKTPENTIEGAVIVLLNVDAVRQGRV
jgi:two-component system CheB/CheR fusion protein